MFIHPSAVLFLPRILGNTLGNRKCVQNRRRTQISFGYIHFLSCSFLTNKKLALMDFWLSSLQFSNYTEDNYFSCFLLRRLNLNKGTIRHSSIPYIEIVSSRFPGNSAHGIITAFVQRPAIITAGWHIHVNLNHPTSPPFRNRFCHGQNRAQFWARKMGFSVRQHGHCVRYRFHRLRKRDDDFVWPLFIPDRIPIISRYHPTSPPYPRHHSGKTFLSTNSSFPIIP